MPYSIHSFISKIVCFAIGIFFFSLTSLAQDKTCSNADVINGLPYNTPFLNNPTTCGAGNNYTRAHRCANYYMDDEDYMFEYTPATGVTCINIQLDAAVTNFDVPTALFVTKGCPDDPNGECIAQFVNVTTNGTTAKPSTITDLSVTPGETYYIQVTARRECYEFTLEVTEGNGCSPTPTGFDCKTAEVIPALPHTVNKTTCGMSTYFKEGNYCSSTIYWDGPQYVMTYTPTESECIKVSGRAVNQTVRMTFNEGCPTYSNSNCDEVDYFYTSSTRSHYYTLTANTTYFFVFSTTASSNGCSGFDVTFSPISSFGSVCTDAIPIDSIHFEQIDQTTRCKGDDYNSGDGCTSWSFNAEDVIYTYESNGMECISASLTNMSSTGGIFLLDACPNAPLANCLAFDERTSTWNQPSTVSLEYTIVNPGTYYIMVGARSTWSSLDYDFQFVSSDVDPIGVHCPTAHNLPSALSVSEPNLITTCKANDYSPGNSLCNMDLISGNEYVLTYTAPTTFCGSIIGKNLVGNGGIMLMDACPDSPVGSCLGATACETSCDSIFIDYTFQAGQTYYIVLGAAQGGSLFGCDLQIKKSYDTADGCVPCDGSSVACVECHNSDFETGTLLRWNGTYGVYNDPDAYSGFVFEFINDPFSRHTVVNSGGYDAVVPALKTTSPEGGRYAIRLGNRDTGKEAETITYQVTVTPDNTMFMYYHAVVLNDPSNAHDPTDQPFFSIEMTDGNGDPVGCVSYEVRSSNPDASFQRTTSALNAGHGIVWKDWTLAVVPLDPYIGQTINIKFITKDCDLGGHYGYAYIDAFCGNIEIEPSNEVLCSGDPITLSAPPGFADYLWSTGENTQTITISSGGVYTVDVAGYGGACSATFTINVLEYDYPTPAFNGPDLVCADEVAQFNDLSISNDTTSIINWYWDFGDGFTDTIPSPEHVFTEAGEYDVSLIVKTSMGCEDTITKKVKYSNPVFELDSIFHPLCYNESTGLIILEADSGIAPYSMTINGLNEGTNVFDSLPADIYSFNLLDDYGCTNDTTIEIIQPDSISIDTTLTHVRCFKENNGQIELFASGGTSPFLFNLDGMPFQTDSIFANLFADTFEVVVQDINLCEKPIELIITQPDTLIFDYNVEHVMCFGDSSGSFEIIPQGGTRPYTYGIDSTDTDVDSNLVDIKAGTYELFTLDKNGCWASNMQMITQPDSLSITFKDKQLSSCINPDGSFRVSTTGGVKPYQFKIDTEAYVTDSVFTNVAGGDHTVEVMDANNCGPYILTINIPTLDEVLIADISTDCDLANETSVITVTVNSGDNTSYGVNELAPGGIGGTWISTYVWESNPIPSNVFYDFRFTDANGCNPKEVSGLLPCECLADAGSFAYSDTVYFCGSDNITFNHNQDEFLESDENLSFIVHDGSAFPVGTKLEENQTGSFNISNLNYNTVYYMVAAAGEGDGTTVNFSDICLDFSEQVPFIVYPPLELTANTNDNLVCPGDNVSIQVDFNGKPDFSLDFEVNGIAQSVFTSDFSTSIVLPINGPTTVDFILLDDISTSPCLVNLNNQFVFDVFEAIAIDNVQYTCNTTNTEYQVSFEITGGDANSYTVDGNSSGTTFTSGWFTNGTGYNFTVTDINDCDPQTVSGNHVCDCTSDAGTMDNTSMETCVNDIVTLNHHGNHVLDGDDALFFVLHDSPVTLGNILKWNAAPTFGFEPGMIAGKTYYVSAVVGNSLGQSIDLDDLCLSVKNFVPVVFHDSPEMVINLPTSVCEGDSVTCTYTINGSFNDYTLNYAYNETPGSKTITNGVGQLTFLVDQTSDLTITDLSNNMTPNCVNTLGDMYTILAQDAPIATVVGYNCNSTATGYTVDLSITGGDASTYLVNGISSTNIYTSVEIPSGTGYTFVITDANNCDPQTLSGTYTCPCITSLDDFNDNDVFVCDNSTFSFDAADATLDANDALVYATSASLTPNAGNIIEWLDNPVINNPGLYLNSTPYYIYAIVGDAIAGNQVDLNQVCTQISTPKMFQYIPLPDVSLPTELDVCFGETVALPLTFSGLAPFKLVLSKNGDLQEYTSQTTDTTIEITGTQGDVFVVESVTSYGLVECTQITNYILPFNMFDEVQINFDVIDPLCYGEATGKITPIITGGYGFNIQNNWYEGQNFISSSITLTDVTAGTYNIQTVDGKGCEGQATVEVENPDKFEYDYIDIINQVCYEDFEGQVVVKANDAELNDMQGIDLNETSTDSLFVNLNFIPGTNDYQITSINTQGCVIDTIVTIEGLTPVKANITSDFDRLCPNKEIIINGTANGGVGNFQYVWNNEQDDSSFAYTGNENTSVWMVALDENLCPSDTVYLDLDYFEELQVDLNADRLIVCPEDTILLSAFAEYGDGNYTYTWKVDNNTTAQQGIFMPFSPTDQHVVAIEIADGCGMIKTDNIQVGISERVQFDILPENKQMYCGDKKIKFNLNLISGDFDKCSWEFGDGVSQKTCDAIQNHHYAYPGLYDLTFTAQDQYGCDYKLLLPEIVQINPQSIADFDVTPEFVNDLDNFIQVTDESLNAESVEWTLNNDYWDQSNYIEIDRTLNEYVITQKTNTSYNCSDSITKTVLVTPLLRVFVPNSFTPNEDGINSIFKPVVYAAHEDDYQFTVYNRWGEILFQTMSHDEGWDGTFGGTMVPTGSYTYKVTAKQIEGTKIETFTGVVNLLR